MTSRDQMIISINIFLQNRQGNMNQRHVCALFCDVTLTLLMTSVDLCTNAVLFLDINQHFSEFWGLFGPSSRPEGLKCENTVF